MASLAHIIAEVIIGINTGKALATIEQDIAAEVAVLIPIVDAGAGDVKALAATLAGTKNLTAVLANATKLIAEGNALLAELQALKAQLPAIQAIIAQLPALQAIIGQLPALQKVAKQTIIE